MLTILERIQIQSLITMLIMRNHHAANNIETIDQYFGNNLKLEVGNNNEPKILDSKRI